MSPFQAQYPLSPRKFWKKFLPSTLFWIVLLLVLIGVAVAFSASGLPAQDMSDITLVLGYIIAGILGLALISLGTNAWYVGAYIRNYFYEGGENFITIKKGVFAPKEIHVQYAKIQDVYVDQDILDRIMGLYDVHIASATATSGMEAHIDGVEKEAAEGLKNFFLAKIQGASVMPTTASGASAPAAPVTAQFRGDITSQTYPIQSSWFPMSVVSSAVASLVYAFFLAGFIWAKTSDAQSDFSFFWVYGAFALVSFVAHIIYLALWKGSYSFSFSPEYIEFRTGVFAKQERHLPYKSIQDVNVNRSLFERVFGLATVVIENAAQMTIQTKYGARSVSMGVRLVGQTPESASKITEALKAVILTKDSSRTGL